MPPCTLHVSATMHCLELGSLTPCASLKKLTHSPCSGVYTHSLYHIFTYIHTYLYTYMCIYVCMYVCMYACMHACMYVCMYVCMYACFVCMYACMHVCMYACMHVCMYACMHVCMYACMCMYMYMYIYIYIYACAHTHTHTRTPLYTYMYCTGTYGQAKHTCWCMLSSSNWGTEHQLMQRQLQVELIWLQKTAERSASAASRNPGRTRLHSPTHKPNIRGSDRTTPLSHRVQT